MFGKPTNVLICPAGLASTFELESLVRPHLAQGIPSVSSRTFVLFASKPPWLTPTRIPVPGPGGYEDMAMRGYRPEIILALQCIDSPVSYHSFACKLRFAKGLYDILPLGRRFAVCTAVTNRAIGSSALC